MDVYWALLASSASSGSPSSSSPPGTRTRACGRGGVESGAGHFPVMVALHFALLAGCVVEPLVAHRTFIPALGWPMIALVLAANGLRWWCIATLGPYWSARVIVIPGTTLVRSGPYRWFAHPNYVAVIVEGAALPLAGSAWITACAFTVLNAALLTVRLRCETRGPSPPRPADDRRRAGALSRSLIRRGGRGKQKTPDRDGQGLPDVAPVRQVASSARGTSRLQPNGIPRRRY